MPKSKGVKAETPAPAAPAVSTQRSRLAARKQKNREDNAQRHFENVDRLRAWGLPPEQTMREVTIVTKQGKNIIRTSKTVVKNKRASKLVRKHLRMTEGISKPPQVGDPIKSTNIKVSAETALLNAIFLNEKGEPRPEYIGAKSADDINVIREHPDVTILDEMPSPEQMRADIAKWEAEGRI